MNYSKKREIIKDVVVNLKTHPTAEDVYNIVKKDLPNISLATIYRNLNMLAEAGVVNKILIPNHSDRFDSTLHKHHHFLCECCFQVCDIEVGELNIAVDNMSTDTFVVKDYSLVFNGYCKDCMKQETA